MYAGHSGSKLDEPSKTIKAGAHGVPGGENMVVLDNGTISNIRPECFSFSLPLLQFQKRFLATSANKAFAINRPVRFSPLLRSGVGDLAKPDTKKWTRLSPCPICASNLLIFIQS